MIPTYYNLTDEQKAYAKRYGYAIMLESYFSEIFTESSPRTTFPPNPIITLFKLSQDLYKQQLAHFEFIKTTIPNKSKNKSNGNIIRANR